MARLGHREFDVLGLSWGGGARPAARGAVPPPGAPRGARRHRHRVADGARRIPRVLRKMLTPRRHRDPAYAASIAAEIYGGTHAHRPRARRATCCTRTTRSGPKRGYYYQLAAMTGWSSLPFLPLLRQPTLVLGGDDDPIIPLVNAADAGPADPARAAARLPRRPPRHPHREPTSWPR